jgi:RNA polymerase sigma factor, sigma-70 family
MRIKNSASDAKTEKHDPLRDIRSGHGEHIARLYDMYRGEFIAFAGKHFSLGEDDAVDVYQESFIALYENIRSGRLGNLCVSLKTYLFRIARNKMLNRQRGMKGRLEPLSENIAVESDDWSIRQEIVYGLVERMEEPCNTVLVLYYWERRNMEEIADAMSYASAQVAKNRKSSCMRKLKNVLLARFTEEGLM